jgi:cellulose synthase/poly-beta-1,6-N-acetylglucosamine synthase-like glycosyltransferase
LRFAILIPAHNEAGAIGRKILSVHHARLEQGGGLAHLAMVIDDHSTDGTAAIARQTIGSLPPRPDLEWRVIENAGNPGKGSALGAGFADAAGYDVLAITDADALVSPDAPLWTAAALRKRKIGAVTGTQHYVAGFDGLGIVGDRRELYDRASEAVRAIESQGGAVFSVHGPWFALRADTGARPTPGVGADDLDLAIQVRKAGYQIVLMQQIPFWEVKPSGEQLRTQQIRRARAYFEVLDRHLWHCLRMRPVPLGALQYLGYAVGPPLLAALFLVSVVAPTLWTAAKFHGVALTLAALLATLGILVLRPFQECLRLSLIIVAARLLPHRARADRWRPVEKT